MTTFYQIKKINIMKSVLLLAISISLYFTSFNVSQAQWKTQTRDSVYNFNGVCFINVYTGWVFGNNGKIFKTQDGGYNWVQQLNNSPVNNLQRMQFPPQSFTGKTGYAVGYVDNSNPNAGFLLQTNDSGYIWQDVWLRNFYHIMDLQFFNAYTGYIVGGRDSTSSLGHILKTTNGGFGATLTFSVDMTFNYGVFKSLSFINPQTGYVSATDSSKNTTILKTFTGADYFVRSTLPGIDIHQMKFINEATGFAIGGGYNGGGAKILRTVDSARTWTVQTFPGANYFNGISFVFARGRYRGWVCGENGTIYNSTNLGVSWYKQKTPFNAPNLPTLNGMSMIDLDIGWVSGNSGTIVTTYTGGDSVSYINVISSVIPDKYNLSQNYPNPFNPETKIRFSVPVNSLVKLTVYNSLGQVVKQLINSQLHAGEYETNFNAEGLSSGIYYYTLNSGSFMKTNKMLLIK